MASPDNVGLRLAFADLLLQAGKPQEALEQCQAALANRPDHTGALLKAADAAERLDGGSARAESYRRLAEAAGGGVASVREEGGEEPVPAGDSPEGGGSPVDGEGYEDSEGKVLPFRVVRGGGEAFVELEPPRVTLDDVAGMEEVKRRLEVGFLGPMRNPELRELYGKSLRGGLLLFGPPGCGKTFIARATAGELGAGFVSIGIADVLDMYLGQSERNLHLVFEFARRNEPCVLFFDEIDALGRKRSLMRNSAERGTVNQLLAELDGVDSDNEGVFVLAATNHLWDVDPALLRPGRFDRVVLVLPPDLPARTAILNMNLSKRPIEEVDFDRLAEATEGFSGADLAHLCESAVELAMEDSIVSGTPRPIRQEDLETALGEIRPSTRHWLETARNYAEFSNSGGIYDDLIGYLRRRKML